MNYSTMSQWGPYTTPPTIRLLILTTSLASILSAALQTVLDRFGFTPGPEDLLSLSWYGLARGYLWQPLTSLFVQESAPYGLSFSFLIGLLFNMYMLWVLGSAIIELVGKKSFLKFYFITGICATLLTLLVMPLIGDYSRLAGCTPAILALLTVWSMAYADAEILFFFLIPIKAKWLVLGIIGAILLVSLSHWDLTYLTLYLSSIVIGYSYAVIAWGWSSPFSQTQNLDRWLTSVGKKLPNVKKESKIVDLQTGKAPSNDDTFIDAMLEKISKHGEDSLSWNEKRRMQQISERKMQKR